MKRIIIGFFVLMFRVKNYLLSLKYRTISFYKSIKIKKLKKKNEQLTQKILFYDVTNELIYNLEIRMKDGLNFNNPKEIEKFLMKVTILWQIYNELSSTTKNFFKKEIFSFNELEEVHMLEAVANIILIWDYLAKLILKDKKEFDKLKELFDECFGLAKEISNLKLQRVGVNFESDLYQSITSKRQGKIKKVLLRGLVYNDKIVRKSIVEV